MTEGLDPAELERSIEQCTNPIMDQLDGISLDVSISALAFAHTQQLHCANPRTDSSGNILSQLHT
jgi:hypothetical protein